MEKSLLHIAKTACREAARAINSGYYNIDRVDIQSKSLHDYVSSVDIEAEQIIVSTISKFRPHDVFITEERTVEFQKSNNPKDVIWVIDPIDGTQNFIKGHSHFCVSIAAILNNEIVASVIYNPITDEMFTAVKGQGAYCNDTRLRIKKTYRGLSSAVVATGFPYKDSEFIPEQFANMEKLINAGVADFRCSGSAALDLCYVAANRVDAYFEKGIRPWDITAGVLIVQEAGGKVSDMQGGSDYLLVNHIIAAEYDTVKELQAVLDSK